MPGEASAVLLIIHLIEEKGENRRKMSKLQGVEKTFR